jgi:hypothetical protein
MLILSVFAVGNLDMVNLPAPNSNYASSAKMSTMLMMIAQCSKDLTRLQGMQAVQQLD